MGHPDTVLRWALVLWPLVAPQTLSADQRQWLTQRLTSHAPLTAAERARVVPLLLAALEGYDARVAARVQASLDGVEDVPGRGARSTEGMVKMLTIVKTLQDAQEAAPEGHPRRRGRKQARPGNRTQ